MSYLFRRTDNDEIVEVDFLTMMEQKGGEITLPDGVTARRCVGLEIERYGDSSSKDYAKRLPDNAAIVSDVLGVTGHQVQQMREDAQRNGFTGVEFVRDPKEPTFFQAKISSQAEWRRYVAHRGLHDKNGLNGSGAAMTPEQFLASARLVERALAERNLPILANAGS